MISSFFKSSNGCFSFSMIFSFLAIFHVLQRTFQNFPTFSVFLAIFHVLKCVFFIFRDCQFSRSIPVPTVYFSFFTFFSDFVIFQVVKWMFLIFHDFQFSCRILCPTVDISKFSNFFSFPRHISPPKVCTSHFLWFSVFWPYSRSYSVHFSIFIFFNMSRHISLPE